MYVHILYQLICLRGNINCLLVNVCSLTLNESGDSTPSEADFCTDRCFSCFYTSTHVLSTVTSKHYNTDNPSAAAQSTFWASSNWMSKITNEGL